MSEYIEIETEFGDDGRSLFVTTNLSLTDGSVETYESLAEMEEGSPLAQALSMIEGIARLTINGRSLTLIREPDTPWHHLVADLSAVLKDFFL
ncbi:MAG: NifU N-terminal domain-containing protein [Ardenticatenaceae bacterium]|nr:NifU N-terminal domain-containing protein [Ardenticatenaceae bacterium]